MRRANTTDAMSESESSELEGDVSTDDMQQSAHESGSGSNTESDRESAAEDMAPLRSPRFPRSPRVNPRRASPPVRRDMPSASEDEDNESTGRGNTNAPRARRRKSLASPSRTASSTASPTASPTASSTPSPKPSPRPIKRSSRAKPESEPKPKPKAERSSKRNETHKPAAVDEAQLRMLAATDAPLPLPDACVKYIHAMEEPERLKRALVKFEDPALHFDPTDIKKTQQLLAAAETRKAAAAEAGIAVDTMAARVAMLARACNERWAQILQMVRDGDLHPDDALMDYLTQRQFQMRRELVDAIHALGEAYE